MNTSSWFDNHDLIRFTPWSDVVWHGHYMFLRVICKRKLSIKFNLLPRSLILPNKLNYIYIMLSNCLNTAANRKNVLLVAKKIIILLHAFEASAQVEFASCAQDHFCQLSRLFKTQWFSIKNRFFTAAQDLTIFPNRPNFSQQRWNVLFGTGDFNNLPKCLCA